MQTTSLPSKNKVIHLTGIRNQPFLHETRTERLLTSY